VHAVIGASFGSGVLPQASTVDETINAFFDGGSSLQGNISLYGIAES